MWHNDSVLNRVNIHVDWHLIQHARVVYEKLLLKRKVHGSDSCRCFHLFNIRLIHSSFWKWPCETSINLAILLPFMPLEETAGWIEPAKFWTRSDGGENTSSSIKSPWRPSIICYGTKTYSHEYQLVVHSSDGMCLPLARCGGLSQYGFACLEKTFFLPLRENMQI